MSVPAYTELLTQNGWKSLELLAAGELVCGLDLPNRAYTWVALQQLSASSAEVFKYVHNDGEAFCATQNQSWIVDNLSIKNYAQIAPNESIVLQLDANVDQLAEFAARAKRNERFVKSLQETKVMSKAGLVQESVGNATVYTVKAPCNTVLIRQEGRYTLIGA
jgi:hypothetical protein